MGDKPLSSASNTPGPSGLSGVSTPVEPPRKEKRKKRREREQAEANAQAGPSSISLKDKRRTKGDGSGAATPIVVEDTPPAPERTFDPGVDFIPFGLSDEPEGEDRTRGKSDRERASDRPVNREREWDRGKGKARQWEQRADERDRDRDRNGGARKRKADDYDRNDGYENKKQRMDAASRKAPWVAGVDWEASANVAELLHREVKAFVHYISPTPEEDEVRSLIVEMISQAVTKNFPDAKVLPFGSFETKLYLPLGDIDLVVLSQSMAYSDRVTVLHALANTLKRAGITDKVTIIAKAKVPIIKFVTIHGRFAVDISINQSNGVEAGKMVNGFLAEMPALQSLVMITKAFLSQRSMNEVFSGGLGSYSIVCLAVSFLQMHPKIRRGEIDPMQNLGVLVMEFFELYGFYFNYQEVGISLRGGGTYYSKVQRGWSDYQKSGLLSIEDPGDPSNDVSKGSYNINRVRQTFAGAHGIMTAAAYMQASVLSARRSGRSVNLRGHTDPGDMSILSSVLGVTQEVRVPAIYRRERA
ncbi:Nucleotidyltransferase [Artomyces pyxidatus]|uniref:Nucleotidyltransferase n=1 Tax=Artomyces pyxidatus TaxID=48021 RepID=A0ACB8T0W9_9AGAM|nr:Nucleotidyltransferase [Artomyces pyxidatus]